MRRANDCGYTVAVSGGSNIGGQKRGTRDDGEQFGWASSSEGGVGQRKRKQRLAGEPQSQNYDVADFRRDSSGQRRCSGSGSSGWRRRWKYMKRRGGIKEISSRNGSSGWQRRWKYMKHGRKGDEMVPEEHGVGPSEEVTLARTPKCGGQPTPESSPLSRTTQAKTL